MGTAQSKNRRASINSVRSTPHFAGRLHMSVLCSSTERCRTAAARRDAVSAWPSAPAELGMVLGGRGAQKRPPVSLICGLCTTIWQVGRKAVG